MNKESIQINCVVCGSNSYRSLFYVSPRRIVKCSDCGHEYVNPIPNQKNVSECKFSPGEEESLGTQIDLVYIKKIFDSLLKQLGTRIYPDLIKGVKKISNKEKIPEHIMKGFFRAKHQHTNS